MANTGKRAADWRTLYEAAVLELNPEKMPVRFAEAQRAIMDRMEDLNRSGEGSESNNLITALNVVRDLRKMAENKNEASD